MKKLLLWLVMVVVMLAVLLGGAGYAMYAMTGNDKLPTQHPTLGDTELEPIGYDWSVPVLGNVLNRTFEQPSTLTVQKLGEMTEAAPELVLPDWAQRTTLTLKDSAGSVVVQGDAAAFAMYAYPKNGSYELTLTAYRNTADPGDATGWYRYCASYTMNIQPKAVLSSERVSQGGVAALVITGILDGSEPTVETDLGDVWFRPVTGGYMGYIPVTYNAEGGPHTLTVTCGSLTQELTLNVMQSEAKTVDVAAEADIPEELQNDIEARDFSATSGGGAVEVVVTGAKNIKALTIKPEVVDKDDVEMLQDLIISAINEAMADVERTTEEEMNKITGGVALPGIILIKWHDNNALPLVILAEQFAKLPGIGMKQLRDLLMLLCP